MQRESHFWLQAGKCFLTCFSLLLLLQSYVIWLPQRTLPLCLSVLKGLCSAPRERIWPSVQSISHVQFLATLRTGAWQFSLSITNSQSLLKLMSIESVMPSNHLILCHPLLLLPSILSHHQGLFQWVSSSQQVSKVLEFQLQHQSFKWIFSTDFL